MKKFLAFAVTAALVFGTFSFAKAGPSVDQQYTGGTGSTSIINTQSNAQTFMPTMSQLDKVSIELASTGGGTTTLTCNIKFFSGGWNTIKSCGTKAAIAGWNDFSFDTTTVTVNERYAIFIDATYTAGNPLWAYTSTSTYDRGYAIWQGADKANWDFNFKSWGTEPTEIVAENTQATEGQNTVAATTTAGSTETLGATSTSIAKPTTLTAAYSDADRGIKLAWKASTTTVIDGYKVFRYEGDVKTPVKIASTAKDKLEYLDNTVVAGKTYYYQIRAYKTDTESVSSNIADATVPADAAPAKPINFKVVDRTFSSLEVMWRKSTDPNISGYTLNLYRGGDKIRTAEIPATVRNYSFLNLDAGTLYKIELIAKTSGGLTSTPAFTIGFTHLPEVLERFMDTTRTIAGLVVLILLLILAINTKKHYKEKK
ncbi:MAG: fibronectin type III domain-containing protein [Candidatus Berkelbacteria bacterium]